MVFAFWTNSFICRPLHADEASDLLDVLRKSRAAMHGKEINVHCISSSSIQVVREDQIIISYPQNFFAFSTDLAQIVATRKINHFFWACIGSQSLKLAPEDFLLQADSGGLIQENESMLRKVRGGTTGSQVLLYYPSGEDMLANLESIPVWQKSKDGQGRTRLLAEKDGVEHKLVLGRSGEFPIVSYEFKHSEFPCKVEYQGLYDIKEIVGAALPKSAVFTVNLKDTPFTIRCEVRGIRDSRIPPNVNSWKEIKEIIGLPDGTLIGVENMRQIKFKWQDGEVVRSIDGKTLDALRGHVFWSTSSRVWVAGGFLGILTCAIWSFVYLRRKT